MDLELEIIGILKRLLPLEFAGSEACDLDKLHERTYRLRGRDRSYFIKWISNSDEYGINEIMVNREILPTANIPTPRLLFESKGEEATLACWEWLEGVDLRHQHRNLLPKAFAMLAEFHAAQRHDKSVYSHATHQAFSTIKEMLEAEADLLCSFCGGSARSRCESILLPLEVGYSTLIHGDMHPGNIRFTQHGLEFVDWGYCTSSLNLFDLDYVRSVPLGEQQVPWWIITPSESESVLPAYFEACGLGDLDYTRVHQAVMLRSELGSYRNCIQRKDQPGAALCRHNIDLFMENAG